MSAICLSGVEKRFGKTAALRDVSFDVPVGSVTGLLGVNGAGKSTLIRILVGLERADGGSAEVIGADPVLDPIGLRRRIGYMPERRVLYEWMTVAECIRFTASFYPGWRDEVADDLLRRFGLSRDSKVGALSRGQYARLAFLLTLGHSPELLILDEPSYGLDPLVRRQFLSTIAEVASEFGRTILLSSHLMSEVERVADRVVMLHRGRVLYEGRLDRLTESTKAIRLPANFDAGRFGDRLVRVDRRGIEAIATVKEFGIAEQSLVPPSAQVEGLSLEDIFCEFAEAEEERVSTAGALE